MPIAILGPTASGKSALAVAVARRVGGVVVNGDPYQAIAGLAIGTGQPGPEEQEGVLHWGYGVLPLSALGAGVPQAHVLCDRAHARVALCAVGGDARRSRSVVLGLLARFVRREEGRACALVRVVVLNACGARNRREARAGVLAASAATTHTSGTRRSALRTRCRTAWRDACRPSALRRVQQRWLLKKTVRSEQDVARQMRATMRPPRARFDAA